MSDAQNQTEDCVFSVVGHHRENPGLLLLQGEDGRFYQYDPDEGVSTLVDLEPHWQVDLDYAS